MTTRAVISREVYSVPTRSGFAYYAILRLECGHAVHLPATNANRKSVICKDCQEGHISTYANQMDLFHER